MFIDVTQVKILYWELNGLCCWSKRLEKESLHVTLSSALGKAIGYALSQLPKIKLYATMPNATLDSHRVEAAIRPFTIGRSNWHFCDSPRGAHASAGWYSLIESAKSANLDSLQYIAYVLEHLSEVKRHT